MKFYLAPMEGITNHIYRNAYEKYFGNIDKYFTPFIVPNRSNSFKTRDLRDVLPENNKGLNIVPQILTNDSEGFIGTARKLQELGYQEINLNLGCPSGTVVSKGRGSGFLANRDELNKFLEEIYKMDDMKISIKTRLGMESPEEFYELIKIYNQYPLEELIIHARTRQDFYGNKPNLEVFKDGLLLSKSEVCYNGDIFKKEDYKNLEEEFPDLKSVMIGRGLLANPAIVQEIKNNIYLDKENFKKFHDEVFYTYREIFNEDKNSMYRMKELWSFMIFMFEDNSKAIKKIKKAQKVEDYHAAVNSLFQEKNLIKGAGFFKE